MNKMDVNSQKTRTNCKSDPSAMYEYYREVLPEWNKNWKDYTWKDQNTIKNKDSFKIT